MFGQIPAASMVKSSSPRTSPLLSSNSSASEQPAETPTDRISNLSPDSRGFSPSAATNPRGFSPSAVTSSRGFSPSAVTNPRGFSPSAVINNHRRESAFISFNHMSPFGRGGVMADIPPSNLSIYPSLYQQTSEPIIDQNLWQKLTHVGLIQPSSQAILSNGAWKQDISSHPYRPSGLSGPYIDSSLRSKNGSRESTGTLKAWLCEHMKNPYPSKGEKIMLAIITKMTLTQVSTWFANARRRLKKESIVNWNDDDDDDEGLDDEADNNNDKRDAADEGDGRQASWKIETGDSEPSKTRSSRDFRQTPTRESNEIDDSNVKRRKNTSPVKHMTDPFVRIPSPSTSPVSPSSSSLSSNEFSSPHSSSWKNRFSKSKDDWETPAEHRIVSRFNNNNNDDVNDDVHDVDDDDDDVRSVKSLAIDMTTSRSSVSNSADSGVPQHGEVRRPRIWSIAEIIAR